MAKWMLRQSTAEYAEVARRIGISPVLARILAVRGYRTEQEVKSFLAKGEPCFADPFLFADMDRAVDTVIDAVNGNKKIVIYGDYDADGVMSTVILMNTLRSLGSDPVYYIPVREGEGYGMNNDAVALLAHQGIDLIITCDNGISSHEEIDLASSLGMKVVVLDHHAVSVDDQGEQILPKAAAVVDAKRSDCKYPYKPYCGAGLCYRFSQAIYQRLGKDWTELSKYCLPFAAIATICDLVELSGENRALVRAGLEEIKNSRQPGIMALINANGLAGKEITSYHIGFILGPCINASGRMDVADTAVELFLTGDMDEADEIAQILVEMNGERRSLTEEGAKLAVDIIEQEELFKEKIIVVESPFFSLSVAGIIAGKLKEKYHHPAIVLAGDDVLLRGSCRSVDAYNIFEGLCACKEHLVTFGGHPMAAGLTVEASKVDAFRKAINDTCDLSEEEMEPTYRIDCPLAPCMANMQLAKELLSMEPLGKDNPEPLFACKGMLLNKISLMGKEERVMRLYFSDAAGNRSEAVSFSGKDKLKAYIDQNHSSELWLQLLAGKPGEAVYLDILYTININVYNGRENVQLRVVDMRGGQKQ